MPIAAANNRDLVPPRMPNNAKFGSAFSRDFIEERGAVEGLSAAEAPLVAAEVHVRTRAIGDTESFYSLQLSLSVFHKDSQEYISAEQLLREMPGFSEKRLALLHSDEFWRTKDPETRQSLAAEFRDILTALAAQGQEHAQVFSSLHLSQQQSRAVITEDAEKAFKTLTLRTEAALCGVRRRHF
jgi:hypothetical protein